MFFSVIIKKMFTLRACSLILVSVAVFVLGRPAEEQMTEKDFTNLVFTVEKFDQILKAYSEYKREYLYFQVETSCIVFWRIHAFLRSGTTW